MRIAILMQDTRTLYGAEKATVQLVQGLVAAGVSVRVLLMHEVRLGEGASPLAAALSSLAPTTAIPVKGRISKTAIAEVRAVMASEQLQVLHSTGYKADIHAVLASRSGKLFPVVSTVHGWLFRWHWKERFFQVLNLMALRRCARVIVLSQFYERYLRSHGLNPVQLAHIPTGFCAEQIAERTVARRLWDAPDEPFTFGFLGRLSEEKNVGLLLAAVSRLVKDLDASPRPWRVRIAGDGPLRAKLERRIETLGLSNRVELAGWMESRDFFQRVHVLVQCSRVENQPLSVMEAMAWMRPTIATRAGGLPEMIVDGETGVLVPLRSARALAAAMKECLLVPEKAHVQGLRARERLEQVYSFEQMVREHIGLYEAEAKD